MMSLSVKSLLNRVGSVFTVFLLVNEATLLLRSASGGVERCDLGDKNVEMGGTVGFLAAADAGDAREVNGGRVVEGGDDDGNTRPRNGGENCCLGDVLEPGDDNVVWLGELSVDDVLTGDVSVLML